MNKKNNGFSLFISIVASMILMGVAVSIIISTNKSLEQVNNIARSNQLFFAAESGNEAAYFHHNVRGAGLNIEPMESTSEFAISHDNIGANVTWGIDGRNTDSFSGEVRENEKITIPLYWDSSDGVDDSKTVQNMTPSNRIKLELSFPGNNNSFDFGTAETDVVLFMWSVSKINASGETETFIPLDDNGDPCNSGYFYCKEDYGANLTIEFGGASAANGKIMPSGVLKNIQDFMQDNTATNYKISFQPILPFTAMNGHKISSIKFNLAGPSVGIIPRNDYTIKSQVTFNDFEKNLETTVKEEPSIGAFDYLIFK